MATRDNGPAGPLHQRPGVRPDRDAHGHPRGSGLPALGLARRRLAGPPPRPSRRRGTLAGPSLPGHPFVTRRYRDHLHPRRRPISTPPILRLAVPTSSSSRPLVEGTASEPRPTGILPLNPVHGHPPPANHHQPRRVRVRRSIRSPPAHNRAGMGSGRTPIPARANPSQPFANSRCKQCRQAAEHLR